MSQGEVYEQKHITCTGAGSQNITNEFVFQVPDITTDTSVKVKTGCEQKFVTGKPSGVHNFTECKFHEMATGNQNVPGDVCQIQTCNGSTNVNTNDKPDANLCMNVEITMKKLNTTLAARGYMYMKLKVSHKTV